MFTLEALRVCILSRHTVDDSFYANCSEKTAFSNLYSCVSFSTAIFGSKLLCTMPLVYVLHIMTAYARFQIALV